MTSITASTALATGRVQLVGIRQRSLLVAKVRVHLVVAMFVLVGIVALCRIAWLGVMGESTDAAAMADHSVGRGEIVDRNGVPLARAFPAYSLWFNPKALGDGPALVKTPAEVAAALLRIFPDEDLARLTARLASGKPQYLRRRIMPEDANRIHALGEPALEFPRENERYYPQGSMAAHVLGYVSADGHGHVGMEQVYERQLTDPATRGTPA
ncbi:MAG TPA: penicillin-binding protein 2, partial [Novosphingobium sp.]